MAQHNLWPYALRHANDCVNNTPNLQDATKQTPHQLFTSTTVMINKKAMEAIWLPCLCFGGTITIWSSLSKMEAKSSSWNILGTITNTQSECGIGTA